MIDHPKSRFLDPCSPIALEYYSCAHRLINLWSPIRVEVPKEASLLHSGNLMVQKHHSGAHFDAATLAAVGAEVSRYASLWYSGAIGQAIYDTDEQHGL